MIIDVSVQCSNNDLDEIVPGCPIVLLCLGATRSMTIRARRRPRALVHVALAAERLLLMGYETQLHSTHGAPKTNERVGVP